MEAIAYVRWSSDDQSEGDSQRRQLSNAQRICKERGWELIDTVIDSGKSAFKGKNRSRGGQLAEIEKRAAKGLLRGKALIIENVDRLSRQEPIVGLNLLHSLVDAGITLVESDTGQSYTSQSIRENWQTLITPFLRVGLAYEEAVKKGGRIKEAFQGTIERGFVTKNGLADLRFVPSWIDRDGADYVVIEKRAKIVRQIFDWCVEGRGLRYICAQLNADIANTRWQRGDWTQSNVRDILRGRGALGEYCRREGDTVPSGRKVGEWFKVCEPVVTLEQWHRAQDALTRRRNSGGKRRGMVNLLQGFTFCAHRNNGQLCGSRMIITQNDKNVPRKARLRCARNHRAAGCSSSTSFHYQHLLDGILDNILHLVLPSSTSSDDIDGSLAAVEMELKSAEGRLDNLIDAYANAPSPAMLRGVQRAEADIELRKSALHKRQREAEKLANAKPSKELVREIAELRGQLADSEEARHKVHSALQEMITGVFLYPETREAHVLVAGVHALRFDGLGNLLAPAAVATSALLPGAYVPNAMALDRYKERSGSAGSAGSAGSSEIPCERV